MVRAPAPRCGRSAAWPRQRTGHALGRAGERHGLREESVEAFGPRPHGGQPVIGRRIGRREPRDDRRRGRRARQKHRHGGTAAGYRSNTFRDHYGLRRALREQDRDGPEIVEPHVGIDHQAGLRGRAGPDLPAGPGVWARLLRRSSGTGREPNNTQGRFHLGSPLLQKLSGPFLRKAGSHHSGSRPR